MNPDWVDVFPITVKNGDIIPASYVSLPEGIYLYEWMWPKKQYGVLHPFAYLVGNILQKYYPTVRTWKNCRAPKGKDHLPTINFQWLLLLVSGMVKPPSRTINLWIVTKADSLQSGFHQCGLNEPREIIMRIQTPQYPLASMCSVIIKILVYFHEKYGPLGHFLKQSWRFLKWIWYLMGI